MPPRKEEEIVIPEAVMNRANDAAMRGQAIADTGSIFTNRERSMTRQQGGIGYPSGPFQQGGLPRFPFGGASSTSLDIVDRRFDFGQDTPAGGFTRTNPSTTFESTQNQANVQYTQDAATRIANRYTIPTVDIARQNISFGSPFGNRFSATDYVNPERAASIESRGAAMNSYNPLPTSPNVGAAGFSRNIETGAGGRVEQIVTPYGIASTTLTPQQVEQRAQARQQAEQMGTMPRTPEQQQALLAQMREKGAGIRQTIAEQNKPNQEIINAFWQKKAEREAQQALTPSFGGYVGNEQKIRAANVLLEAENRRQVQSGQRSLTSDQPISAFGFQFRRGSMGQYFPLRTIENTSGMVPSVSPQPASAMQTTPQAGGFMASGIMPSFDSIGTQAQEKEAWLRKNFPQDYFATSFGGQGKRMIARNTPFDQIRPL